MIDPEKVVDRVPDFMPVEWGPHLVEMQSRLREIGMNSRAYVTAIVHAVVEAVNAELAATAAALESGDPAMLEQASCLLMARFGERMKEQSAL